jgi:hypothetical protein
MNPDTFLALYVLNSNSYISFTITQSTWPGYCLSRHLLNIDICSKEHSHSLASTDIAFLLPQNTDFIQSNYESY